MTGREKIEAAFSESGTDEIPAVICYEGIYVRDHWSQLTSAPWWHQEAPDLELQMAWRRKVIERTGQDWFRLPWFYRREEQEHLLVEEREEGVFRVDQRTGERTRLTPPRIGGWAPGGGLHSVHPDRLVEDPEEIDALIPDPPGTEPRLVVEDGRGDLARRMLEEFDDLYPIAHVGSPLWRCYGLWGFEGMMTMIASRPELVEYVCGRALALEVYAVREAAALGASGIWIEECLTDMISPQAFSRLALPFLVELVAQIRAEGMHSIYYFCGDPSGKWDQLFDVGADALALEESKKGFTIDVEEVVERARSRCAVLGNLDAVGVLQDGTEEELRREIARQLAAGRKNRSRFVMSTGSPVTPDTPVERVRLYCDLVHELGRG